MDYISKCYDPERHRNKNALKKNLFPSKLYNIVPIHKHTAD